MLEALCLFLWKIFIMILELSTADIYYEIKGKGPYLFIVQSGEGDANRTSQLVEELKDDFTVVTYDRRGLSRSIIKVDQPITISTHAADLSKLISSISNVSVNILGCSIGAVIALKLAETNKSIKTLIAHEPVIPSLLPEGEQHEHIRELKEIRDIYINKSWLEGIKYMAEVLGINLNTQTREPNAIMEPMTIERKSNFDFFIKNDLESILNFNFSEINLNEIEKQTTIIPIVGKETNPRVFDYKCAKILAKMINKPIIQFPGGHNGNCTHPKGYAAMVKSLLN